MSNFQRELLSEIIERWDNQEIDGYLLQLITRRSELEEWIKHVQAIKRKRTKKAPLENGPRDGR